MITFLALLLIRGGCSQSNKSTSSPNVSETETPETEQKSGFPKKPIQLIVHYGAGSATEKIARVLG